MLLKRELSTEPDAATKSLVAELRSAREASPRATAAAPRRHGGGAAACSALPDRPSIAVLPFANMSSDPEQDYFADGIVEDILTALSRESWLFVIARNSSFAYKGAPQTSSRSARELGVRYVVEGSVRKAANRVRVTAQLIEAETGAHIWADRYERDLERHLRAAGRDHAAGRGRGGAQLARARDPARPGQAHREPAGLRLLPARAAGDPHPDRGQRQARRSAAAQGGRPRSRLSRMRSACWPTSSPPRTVNGWHENILRGLEESLEMARRALAAGPENSTCLACAASTYVLLGRRFEEGVELAERALGCTPTPCSCAIAPAWRTSIAARPIRHWSTSRWRGV